MALLNDPGFPREDWRCMEVADLLEAHDGRLEVACEACGTPIRFLHVLEHDGYDAAVTVCIDCSGALTGDRAGARTFEARTRSKSEARDAWLAGAWRETPAGMLATEGGGLRMGVYPARSGGWGCRIEETFFPARWPTAEQAKYALFDELQALSKNTPRRNPRERSDG